MNPSSTETGISSEHADRIVTATRTSLGDTLRSVVCFTPSAFDVLYVRQDLYDSPEAARDAKARLVELETVGFAEAPVRSALSHADRERSVGDYSFTVRFYDDGFVVRKLVGDVGVLLTADSMDVNAFEDAVGAVEELLTDR